MLLNRVFVASALRSVFARPSPAVALRAPLTTSVPLQLAKSAEKPKAKPKRATKPATKSASKPQAKADKPKKKAKPAKKDKPWEARDANGKLLPLPMESKPTRRSSFLIYFTERLPQLKNKEEFRKVSPSTGKSVVDVTAVTSAVGKEWKTLPDAERQRIDKLAAHAKQQYEKDLKAWQEKLTPEDIRRQNLYYAHQRKLGKHMPSNLKDPSAPKRPQGAFLFFVQHLRETEPSGEPVHVIAKRAGERWKTMDAHEKHPFETKAQGEHELYQQALEKYKKATTHA